jgi:hypothetical protein
VGQRRSGDGDTGDEDLATNEAFILDIRDRLLTIPGVREFARERGLDAMPRPQSACIDAPRPEPADAGAEASDAPVAEAKT